MRRSLSKPLVRLLAFVAPPAYVAYMRWVFATSRFESEGLERGFEVLDAHDGVVLLSWHEEIFAAPYTVARLGVRLDTLASTGDPGEVIARVLSRCGHVAFRGGSSRRRSRRRPQVMFEMIEHMRSQHRVVFGITVDGSSGPAYHMKRGGVTLARESGRPILLARVWFRRCLRLPTWDRTAIPLPYNLIRCTLRGPYFVPDEARTRPGLERFRGELERELRELAAGSYREMGQPLPPALCRERLAPGASRAESPSEAASGASRPGWSRRDSTTVRSDGSA